MFSKKPTGADIQSPATLKAPQPLFDKAIQKPGGDEAVTQARAPAGNQTATQATQTQKDMSMNTPPTGTVKPAMTPSPMNPAPAFRPDLVRQPDSNRRGDMQGSRQDGPATRKLTVGPEISLSGEISACDFIVVEGTVEARVREGKHIEITATGLYKGTVEIEEADIAGRFEGDITVHGRLRVRSTGRIDGKIQYGELEIEAGGHIEGEVHGLKPKATEKPGFTRARTIGISDQLAKPETAQAIKPATESATEPATV